MILPCTHLPFWAFFKDVTYLIFFEYLQSYNSILTHSRFISFVIIYLFSYFCLVEDSSIATAATAKQQSTAAAGYIKSVVTKFNSPSCSTRQDCCWECDNGWQPLELVSRKWSGLSLIINAGISRIVFCKQPNVLLDWHLYWELLMLWYHGIDMVGNPSSIWCC